MSNRAKDLRREQAKERQAAYDQLSLQQKLDRLPPPPHCEKQRAKLLSQMSPGKKPASVTEETIEENDVGNLKAKDRRAAERKGE